MDSGVAQAPIADLEAYKVSLRERVAQSRQRIQAFVKMYA
jgi:malate dehydrogenase (oxaloacetate-decarboxylating)(NADP+)